MELSAEGRPSSADTMCLIVFAFHCHPSCPLILAANRDEFYARPSDRARFWTGHPDLLAGRDLKYGGTWMGMTRSGRFAAVTNYRDKKEVKEHPLSRGLMVRAYLTGEDEPGQFLDTVISRQQEYNGFNLLLGDISTLVYYSNRNGKIIRLEPGVYGLSNHLLDTPWPKTVRTKFKLEHLLMKPGVPDTADLFRILADRDQAADAELPDTGFGIEWERVLSSPFIVSPTYGTRASTVLIADKQGSVKFEERAFTGPDDPGFESLFEFSLTGI
ncbi:MAG: NRDE family protein [Pseudomonadota bacterium]